MLAIAWTSRGSVVVLVGRHDLPGSRGDGWRGRPRLYQEPSPGRKSLSEEVYSDLTAAED
jgi:hypothetical protein